MVELQPNEYSLVLLALLPPAAGVAFLRALWLTDDVARGSLLLYGCVAGGVAAGAMLAPYLRTRPMPAKRAAQALVALCAGAFGLSQADDPMPAPGALAIAAVLCGLTLVAAVVTALWIAGRYRIELVHKATIHLIAGRKLDYYQAICDCGWHGPRMPMTEDDDGARRAVEQARKHTPKVRDGVQYPL